MVVHRGAFSSVFGACLGLGGASVPLLYPDLPSDHDTQTHGD